MSEISRNRMSNTGNEYQGHFRKVLCVCSAGLLRSPTMAEILSREPFNFNARAVGTSDEYALIPLDLAHLAWADDVVVMDHRQKSLVDSMIPQLSDYNRGFYVYTEPKVYCLDVPDNFGFRDPKLVEILTEKAYEIFIQEQ